jgi:hypothetical protein
VRHPKLHCGFSKALHTAQAEVFLRADRQTSLHYKFHSKPSPGPTYYPLPCKHDRPSQFHLMICSHHVRIQRQSNSVHMNNPHNVQTYHLRIITIRWDDFDGETIATMDDFQPTRRQVRHFFSVVDRVIARTCETKKITSFGMLELQLTIQLNSLSFTSTSNEPHNPLKPTGCFSGL